ncbi:MAG TPA: cysteine desulfurase [Leptospiraceae bacterium]|nr:cysteine desulfurase [Leptospiraceae bacterium]HMW07054.1 cysteine desulfurase [Leptospiraceae bacterium]HMX32749.1 cysteine desulfurase [Leptospiraceae bacterium]HMZ66813.1 cysteine desulfurase [Leptospiraceae bacterium]HNA07786.1 cysteine desulfurase [Leptospiraceae bacterium]
MEPFDTSFIAQIASKLYNELPKANSISGSSFKVAANKYMPEKSFSGKEKDLDFEKIQEIVFGKNTSEITDRNESVSEKLNLDQKTISESVGTLKKQQSEIVGERKYDNLKSFVESIQGKNSNHNLNWNGLDNCVFFQKQSDSRFVKDIYSNQPFDVNQIRKDFPVLNQKVHGKPLAWFDNAATTQKPKIVIDAISHYYSNDNSNIHRGAHTLAARSTDAFEDAREKVKNFIKASSTSEIIFVRGTTEAINLVAQTYGRKYFQAGDEIILSQAEHHANIVPWQIVAKEKGAIIRVIPLNERGEVILEDYERLLGPRTKFVSLTQASNSLGTILPVKEMIGLAKRHGAKVLIDGAQSVAHIPVNVQDLEADFFVFSGHKIFGPTGIGVVYGRKEILELMPPWQGGGNMIKNVTFEETTYSDLPAKFEAGTPNIADAVGLGAALDYVNSIGLENIAKYEHSLLEYATAGLTQIKGLRLIGTAPNKVGVLSFVLQNKQTSEVGRLLDLEGIAVRAGHHCAQPSLRRYGVESTVRPSLSFYNTKEEIDRLVDAVRRIAQNHF